MSEQTTDQQSPPGSEAGPPPFRYNARLAEQIELRWQDYWESAGTFHSPNPVGRSPAPTGRPAEVICARHVPVRQRHRNPRRPPDGYIATDVYARFLRMTGHHVLHAMGFDAFGLPAEQFALGTGQHPQVTTRQNTDNMRRQLRRLGMGYDTRRSVDTTDPGFYRWTQWIFLQIFNSWVDERTGRARPVADLIAEFSSGLRPVPGGRSWTELTQAERHALIDERRLAYIAEEPVNWCPGLGTVLANEEVTTDGRSDIGDFPVYRRPMRQWMLRITAMAQRLIDDLDELAWPENVSSSSATGSAPATAPSSRCGHRTAMAASRSSPPGRTRCRALPTWCWRPSIRWQTAWPRMPGRPDAAAVAARRSRPAGRARCYREATSRRSDRQRTAGGGEIRRVHRRLCDQPEPPAAVPVFVADYVLMGYGTGAIMAVPAHDERDLDFARTLRLHLPVGRQRCLPPHRTAAGRTGREASSMRRSDWLERGGHGAGRPSVPAP